MNNIIGKVHAIMEEQKVSDKFKKRDLVLEYAENPQYPQYLLIQFVQDRTDLLNNIAVGQDVEVSINLRGRAWTAPDGTVKYFNTLEGWRISPVGDGQPQQPQVVYQNQPSAAAAIATPALENINDDLPF